MRVPLASSRDTRHRGTGLGSSQWLAFFSRHAILITLLAFIAGFTLLRPEIFFTRTNLNAILATQAVLLIVALAVTIPLASGDFDLSIGFTLNLTMAMTAYISVEAGWHWLLALVLAVLVGVGVGIVNAFLIVILDVSAFVVTLGMATVLQGLMFVITGGRVIFGLPDQITNISRHEFFDIPLVTWYAFALAVVLWYVYEHTPLGGYLTFVGQARTAAGLAGVPVKHVRFGAFVAAATICGIAGVLAAAQLGGSDPNVGPTVLLPAYAAAFLGATTIKVGRFNSWGTVLALFLLATGVTGLQLMGAPFFVDPLFNGAALVLAVTFARVAQRRVEV